LSERVEYEDARSGEIDLFAVQRGRGSWCSVGRNRLWDGYVGQDTAMKRTMLSGGEKRDVFCCGLPIGMLGVVRALGNSTDPEINQLKVNLSDEK
jgi:hypothetical protein